MSDNNRFLRIKKRFKYKEKTAFNEIKDDLPVSSYSSVESTGIFRNQKALFLSLVVFRVIICLIVQTSSVPDEYWQSTEIAHKLVFNTGYYTWEWLPEVAIRSPIYPLVFTIPFKMLKLFGIDHRLLIIKFPLFIHAILAGFTDFYLYKLSFQLGGYHIAKFTLISQTFNWFTFYMSTRTLVNNVEWSLTVFGLYLYYRTSLLKSQILSSKFLMTAALCFVIRPTSLVVFGPIVFYHIFIIISSCKHWSFVLYRSFINMFWVGLFVLTVSVVIEKHFYGQWTCSQWNFIHFNLLTDVSSNYGVHPWHWYWTNGIPAILTTQIILLVVAVICNWNDPTTKKLAFLFIIIVQLYSFLGHKEFRFIFPTVPLAMIIIGRYYGSFDSGRWRRFIIGFMVVTQVPLILYMCLIHQRGTLDVVKSLGRLMERDGNNTDDISGNASKLNISAVFLMPCHSTPWMSYLHHNLSARFLKCDPQIIGGISFLGNPVLRPQSLMDYDEADKFYDNPVHWLLQEYSNQKLNLRPTYWIMFDQLVPQIQSVLIDWNYHFCKRFFHTHFPTHSRHSNRISVFCASNVPQF